jgi:hypothetical protein
VSGVLGVSIGEEGRGGGCSGAVVGSRRCVGSVDEQWEAGSACESYSSSRLFVCSEADVFSVFDQYEAVPESLKNLLLVLHSSNLLLPPLSPDSRTDQQREFWDSTAARIERFLPTFLAGVLPSPEPSSGPKECEMVETAE